MNVHIIVVICLAVVHGKKRLVLHSDQDILTLVASLESEIAALKHSLDEVKQENKLPKGIIQGGSTFTRWGKESCPSNGTHLVYKGYAAGNLYTSKGGGIDTLCLPDDPTWNKQSSKETSYTFIYGTEFEGSDTPYLLGYNYYNQDIPCAVCESDRSHLLMIPGRSNCYSGWTEEYTGYLLSGHANHASSDYICLDENPDAITHGGADDNGHLMYFVKSTCKSLSCPPYVDGFLLACVVCSK